MKHTSEAVKSVVKTVRIDKQLDHDLVVGCRQTGLSQPDLMRASLRRGLGILVRRFTRLGASS